MRTRLLIADEDEFLLGLEDRFFSAHGFEVETAASGVECFEKMRRFSPDVAIIDAAAPQVIERRDLHIGRRPAKS